MPRRKNRKPSQRSRSTEEPQLQGGGTSPGILQVVIKAASYIIPVIVTIGSILPFFLKPSVQVSDVMYDKSPFSLTFEITNGNVFPLLSLRYECVVPIAVTLSGSRFINTHFHHIPSERPVLWGWESTTARCDQPGIGTGRGWSYAEHTLRVSYFPFLGLWRKNMVYIFDAVIDRRTGQIARWVPR